MCRYISWKFTSKHQKKPSKPKYYKAGVILVDQDNKFLLVKNYNSKWTFPKGGIEPGESAQAAAQRELFEETGIEIPLSKLVLTCKYYKHTYFICSAKDLEYQVDKIQDKAEITAIGWFCFKHLNEYQVAKPTLKILEELHQDITAA